jgi:hypothetical protein
MPVWLAGRSPRLELTRWRDSRWLKRVQNKITGGSIVVDAMQRQGEHGARHPGSCTGAAETDASRAVPGAVGEQGSGRRAWAARERLGRARARRPAGKEKVGQAQRNSNV